MSALYAGLAAVFGAGFASAQGAAPAGVSPRERPRLVVMVAVDQMIPAQLERLAPLLHGGLGRFQHRGLRFREASLGYGDTETGPGHATYGTGTFPRQHGIVGNDWVLPEERSPSYCVADPDARRVAASGVVAGAGMSPRNIRRPGLIDHLKVLDPRSIGFAVSSKDRSAIGMSGQRPELALWWDRADGGFVTSTWYAERQPAWLVEFNANWLASFRAEFGGGWKPLDVPTLDGTDTAPDDSPGEAPYNGRHVFPYPAPKLDGEWDAQTRAEVAAVVYGSPAGDQLVVDLARRAVVELELGQDEHVDVLCVSLSSCDTVGHAFGPRSREVTDVLLRADRQLELLFADLDRRVGPSRWIASLSADHGVLDLPEALRARGIGAERVSSKTISATVKEMRARLEERFGADFFLMYDVRGVRLSWQAITAAGFSVEEVRREAARVLEKEGRAWLERAWTLDEIRDAARDPAGASGWKRAWANSFDEQRTPDLTFQSKPWKLLAVGAGTTHGTPYDYDARVPLAFYGDCFPAGESFEPAASADALPTLMAALGLELPAGLDGRSRLPR